VPPRLITGAYLVNSGVSKLLPIVPTAPAGLGPASFSAGLLGLYLSFVLDAVLSRGDDAR
jgi:hypothetical protein